MDRGKHIRGQRWTSRVVSITTLTAAFLLVHWLAYWVRFDGQVSPQMWKLSFTTWPLFAAVKLAVFWRMRIVDRWWLWATFHDMIVSTQAVSLAAVLLAVADYLCGNWVDVPRSVLLLDWLVTIVALGGVRAAGRWAEERCLIDWLVGRKITKAFILGANAAGETLKRAVERSPALHYRIVGFIAESPNCPIMRVGSTPVVGHIEQLPNLLSRYGVGELLVVADQLPGSVLRRVMEIASQRQVTIRIVPSYERLLSGRVDVRPRQIAIEDLLRREPVKLDDQALCDWISGKIVLVTGSAGSIGSEICRQLVRFQPAQLIAVDRSESAQFFLEEELQRMLNSDGESRNLTTDLHVVLADLNEPQRIKQIFANYQPDIIFHAAAYKHVPLLERHPGEAVKNITIVTQMLVDIVAEWDAEAFVFISTDKAVNPRNVMGACKRLAELYVQAHGQHPRCRFVTVRFGNVLNSAGSVVPVFQQQIARGGPVTVTHPDMKRYFMTIPEAAQLVIQAGHIGQGGQTLLLDMGEPVRIVDLARDMIRLSGLREGEDVEIQFVGLRPGEKLEEELSFPNEQLRPTSHPKIRKVVAGDRPNAHWLSIQFDELYRAATWHPEEVPILISRILPEYQYDQAREWSVPLRRRAA